MKAVGEKKENVQKNHFSFLTAALWSLLFQGCRLQQPGGQVEVHGRHAQHRQGHGEGRGDGL